MKNLKFVTVLRTLSKQEVQDFHKYLKHLHKGEDVALRVFEYIRKLYPGFEDHKMLEMAYAYRKMFREDISENEHNRKKMLNALSDLYLWLKDFLLSEKARRDTPLGQVLWLDILQEREGLKAEFSRQAPRFYEEMGNTLPESMEDCLKRIAASYFQYQELVRVRPAPNLFALQQCIDAMERNAKTISLKIACQMADLKKVRPSDPDAHLVDSLESEPVEESPLNLLYEKVYHLLSTRQEVYYHEVEALLKQYAEVIDRKELHGILRYLHNHAAAQIRNGHEAVFAKKLHDLNRFCLHHRFFSSAGEIADTEFANIVNVACSVKDFSWASSFIATHNHLLSHNTRRHTVKLAQAIVFFEQRNFKEALKALEQSEFKDIHEVIRSRVLVLRCYFELQEDVDTILNYCMAFETWLKRHSKPSTGAVEAMRAFISVLKMIVSKKTDQQTLLRRIEMTPNLTYKTWLLVQAAGYQASYATRKQTK